MLRLILLAGVVLSLGACAARSPHPVSATPLLHLPPAELGRDLALMQRLEFVRGAHRDSIEALLEADENELRLVLHSAGQVGLRMRWDGQQLSQQRSDWLPELLSAERVLSDLQLVYWPAASVSRALPTGWRIIERDAVRELFQARERVASVTYLPSDGARLLQHRLQYELLVHSEPVTP